MSVSFLPEIQTLRKTLLKWKEEILNYFSSRLTNARLEGFNCKASLLKRRAYGYRNPENYRIQLLNACS
jgi:transposase